MADGISDGNCRNCDRFAESVIIFKKINVKRVISPPKDERQKENTTDLSNTRNLVYI